MNTYTAICPIVCLSFLVMCAGCGKPDVEELIYRNEKLEQDSRGTNLIGRLEAAVEKAHVDTHVGEYPSERVKAAVLPIVRSTPIDVLQQQAGKRCRTQPDVGRLEYRGLQTIEVDVGDPIYHIHFIESEGIIVDVGVTETPICL